MTNNWRSEGKRNVFELRLSFVLTGDSGKMSLKMDQK